MELTNKPSTQKWDSEAQRTKKQLSKRKKLAILRYYDDKMAEGCDREVILEQLGDDFGVGDRQVERILSQARGYAQAIKEHHVRLSVTALKLAEIMDRYFKNQQFSIEPLISSDFPYSIPTPGSQRLRKREFSNFASHLKEDMPELVPIVEYSKVCKNWFKLGDKKWAKKTPVVIINENLIMKLRVIASQTDFPGKCRDCPK